MLNSKLENWSVRDSLWLVAITALAIAVRMLFFTGFFGSDEVTYLDAAIGVYTGEWPSPNYIGSLRYGVNIPMALFMHIFGISEYSAGLWGILTSVAEVSLVYIAGRLFWNTRAAILAALFLSTLPIHVSMAGRLMADSPLAFFITSSFILLWLAERKQNVFFYIAAGLAAGTIFWIKGSVMVICVMTFALYAISLRRWHKGWFWMAAAAAVPIIINCLLLWWISGDALHIFRSSLSHNMAGANDQTSAGYYLKYLLLDIRHTWILMYLALAGCLVWLKTRPKFNVSDNTLFVVVWATSLLFVFSLLVIHFNPLQLIPKQTNYMPIFVAPLALLAGYAVSKLEGKFMILVCLTYCSGSLILSALEQQVIQIFTENSRASVQFADEHPDAVVFAGDGAYRAQSYYRLLHKSNARTPTIQFLPDLDQQLAAADALPESKKSTTPRYFAIRDPETAGWGNQADSRWEPRLNNACFKPIGSLQPAPLGNGHIVVLGLQHLVALLPSPIRNRAEPVIGALAQAKPGTIFEISADCLRKPS